MATFKSIGYQSIGTTPVEVYNVPYTEETPYNSIVILGMTISNISVASADVTITIKSDGNTITLVSAETLAVADTKYVVFNDKLILLPDDAIEVTSSTASSIDFHMSFMADDGIWVEPPIFGNTGLFFGGYGTPVATSLIESITISSATMNASYGNLSDTNYKCTACSSGITGLISGGNHSGGGTSLIESVEISSGTMNASYGNLSTPNRTSSCSSKVTAIHLGGYTTVRTSAIESVEISSATLNASYGNLSTPVNNHVSCSDGTIGLSAGGYSGAGVITTLIESVEISSATINSSYGNLDEAKSNVSSCANETIGLFAGGQTETVRLSVIESVIIASGTMNTTFSNLGDIKNSVGGCTDGTLGVFAGGYNTTTLYFDTVESVEISSGTLNGSFATLSATKNDMASCSGI